MATTSSAWLGQPTAPGVDTSQRTRNAQAQGQEDSMGYLDSDQRQKQTGVNTGQGGYVSGQVAPAGNTTAPTTGVPRGAAPVATQPQYTAPAMSAPAPVTSVTNPAVDSDGTVVGNSSPAPADDITTKQSALTAPGSTTVSASGTGSGKSPVPVGSSISPTVYLGNKISPGLGDKYDIGGRLLTPSAADLSPTIAAQNAAFDTAGGINQERYDYRPGEAASQERVALDTANADQVRKMQLASLGGLNDAANGRVPSVAELQLRSQAAKNAAANLGAARALGGRSVGGVAHQATIANAGSALDTNVAAAALRAQEIAQARNQEVQAQQGVRGQDVTTAEANANLAQAANKNNLDSQNEQNKLADQHRLALLDAQLKAMGIGTTAAGDTVSAAAKNAASENESKQGVLKAGSSLLSFL